MKNDFGCFFLNKWHYLALAIFGIAFFEFSSRIVLMLELAENFSLIYDVMMWVMVQGLALSIICLKTLHYMAEKELEKSKIQKKFKEKV